MRGTSGVPRTGFASSQAEWWKAGRINNRGTHSTFCQEANCTMSRQSMAPQRNLSLTEELEKLEQSITLTLQGKQSCPMPPANWTDKRRNRPKLQSSTPHRHYWHPAHSRAIWKTLRGCVGRIKVLEAVLRGKRERVALRIRSAQPRRVDCARRD